MKKTISAIFTLLVVYLIQLLITYKIFASDNVWVDDALPAGAGASADGGDSWNWITGNPTPYLGSRAHQSNLAAGLHEHWFNWAYVPLSISTGDTLYTYVYLDPANPPAEIMLSWGTNSWEHRAYWGANNITYGTNGTPSRYYVGSLPPAGQWVRLEVPASAVALEGSAAQGMCFSLFGGRATWDDSGKSLQPAQTSGPSAVTIAATNATATIGSATSTGVITFTRAGSTSAALTVNYALGGSAIKWDDYRTTNGDMPVSVTIPAGSASTTLTILAEANETNANPETATFTLSPNAAYAIGEQNSAMLTIIGASSTTTTSGSVGTSTGSTTGTTTGSTTPPSSGNPTNDTVWVDDALPAGAGASADGGDSWNWITGNPTPYLGSRAHQSNLAAGLHEHWFNWAYVPLSISTGDTLYTYVYLDPANPPAEIMLSWGTNSWEHRAYWGANNITYGTNGTPSRYYVGSLPPAGQWVRLEVPASAVALEGSAAQGMCFSLFGGRATWDDSGKSLQPAQTSGPSAVTIAATNATATIGSATSTGVITFTRAGSTSAALTVNYALGGSAIKWDDYRTTNGDMPVSVTIPAGSASTTLTILAEANETNANPETATFTLSPNAAYAIGEQNSAMLTIASSSSTSNGGGSASGSGSETGSGSSGSGSGSGTGTGTGTGSGSGTGTTPANSVAENAAIMLPHVGDNALHILTPTLLELERINTQPQGALQVDSWNFVGSNNNLQAPALAEFTVTVNGQPVPVQGVGFKRLPRYAPLRNYDLRIANCLYLQLVTPVTDGQTVVVQNLDGSLWPSSMQFTATADPLRFSPAIHVNQEGYVPTFPKKAMVGYYLGNLGEMNVPSSSFALVNATTGATVYQGTLAARPDVGYTYSPTPYQKVLVADFSNFTTPGEYQVVVPGLGASLPFLINDGIAMGFLRTYELGLYHRRSGMAVKMPFTRFTHDADHTAPAQVPANDADPQFAFTWKTIAGYASGVNSNNPPQTAPLLTSEANSLYPFVNTGTVDVSGGHFDAGDYSKYTINCAALVHHLMFAADSIPGVAALDNLGIPESGDGIPDILQEAKWEADYIAKLQDADGGFYFIVYPKNREYENNVSLTNGDDGDPQVVWPKNTSATAAAVAALAQCASSPLFKKYYPATAALYLQKATLGWQFLMNAIAKYGRAGAYQKITFYGDDWKDNDEEAWAACEMYLATGDLQYQQQLFQWFPDPSDPSTFRWGWWRMAESYGCAIRSYAFAARSGRLVASQLDPNYLAKCEAQIVAAGDDAVTWSQNNAYGTAFPTDSKHVQSAGWYFSLDQASDIAVAYVIDPKPAYIDALVSNMNYECGCNPVNVTYLTGLGLKRQREIVDQYAQNNRHVLPPSGIPLGNIQSSFDWLSNYGSVLNGLCFPQYGAATAPYPMYDRWADAYNVTTEFIAVNNSRSIMALGLLAGMTSSASTPWTSVTAQIVVPTTTVSLAQPVTLSFQGPAGVDLSNARIVWEARDQEPDFGPTYTISPKNNGPQWVELEIELPDGRRIFGTNTFNANSPVVNLVDGAVPAGASTSSAGGDAWTWVTSNPAPYSAPAVHQSNVAAGIHYHAFSNTTAPLVVATGDTLFAYVYLDPANMPSEVMLTWNDGSPDHRAYWGADSISWGANGTASQFYAGPLPAAGQWVKLTVPASAVGLEGSTVTGMGFVLVDGRATWDVAGKASPTN